MHGDSEYRAYENQGAELFDEGTINPWLYLIAAGEVGLEM